MAVPLTFDVLPSLNEGDERIPLSDILAIRDDCLIEGELYALCRECCLALQNLHSSDMFQALCITPDTLAFDTAGGICFLDSPADPEQMYVPPEYDTVGNSFKGHLYSLGMTMLFAAEYNALSTGVRKQQQDLDHLVNLMTLDEYERRIDMDNVLAQCNSKLGDTPSLVVCQQLVVLTRLDCSTDYDRTSLASSTVSVESAESLTPVASPIRQSPTSSPMSFEAFDKGLPPPPIFDLDNKVDEEEDDETFMKNVQEQLKMLRKMSPFTTGGATDTLLPPPSGFRGDPEEVPREGSPSPPTLPPSPKKAKESDINKNEIKRVSFRSPQPEDFVAVDDIKDSDEDDDDDVFVHEILVDFDSETDDDLNDTNEQDVNKKDINNPVQFAEGNEGQENTPSEGHISCQINKDDHWSANSPLKVTTNPPADDSGLGLQSPSLEDDLTGVSTPFATPAAIQEAPLGHIVNGSLQMEGSTDLANPGASRGPLDLPTTSLQVVSPVWSDSIDLDESEGAKEHLGDCVPSDTNTNGNCPANRTDNQTDHGHLTDSLKAFESQVAHSTTEQDIQVPTKTDPSQYTDDVIVTSGTNVTNSNAYPADIDSNKVSEETEVNVLDLEVEADVREGEPGQDERKLTRSTNLNGLTPSPNSAFTPVKTCSKSSQENDSAAPLAMFAGQLSNALSESTRTQSISCCASQAQGDVQCGCTGEHAQGLSIEKDHVGEAEIGRHGSCVTQGDHQKDNQKENTKQKDSTETKQKDTKNPQRDNIKSNFKPTKKDLPNSQILLTRSKSMEEGPTGQHRIPGLTVSYSSVFRTHNPMAAGEGGCATKPNQSLGSGKDSATNGTMELAVTKKAAKADGSTYQSIQAIIKKLQCGLHENEVWALCRECVLALQRTRHELPDYISLETVGLEETGRVVFLSIPEDQVLEVIYLSPELQRNGLVTERTCIYGISAMLFLAADYNMPHNQEPALSEELEILLLKMANEDVKTRPGIANVLQACNEYQKKQEVSSTKLCQTIYNEAHKAEAYGRENALVRDIIDKEIIEKAENTKAIIVDSIKLTALQKNLKPVAERKLNEKKVIKTQHEQLVEEIRNPSRKLRKSSKPKEYDVRQIFLHDPELMRGLLRITGIQQVPISSDDVYDNPVLRRGQNGPVSNNRVPVVTHVPNAYSSPATHFSPIILPQNGLPPEQDPSKVSTDKDKKVVRGLKELKRNLMAKGSLSLAKDVENDAVLENRTPTPRYSKSPRVPHEANNSRQETPVLGHVTPSQSHLGPNQGLYPGHMLAQTVLPSQALPYQNLPIYPSANGQYAVTPPVSTPTVTSTPTMPNTSALHGSMPDLSAMTYQNYSMIQAQLQAQGQMQVQGQVPGQGQYGIMPTMQMQLQQDPRTGLLQLVPVAFPQVMPQSGAIPGSQTPFYSNQSTASAEETPPAGHEYVTYDDLLKALQLKDRMDSDDRSEKRRYVKQQSRDKGKEEKLRGRAETSGGDREGARDTARGKTPERNRTRSRSRDNNRRSRTLSSIEIQSDLEKALLENKQKSSHNARVKKSTSMEMLNDDSKLSSAPKSSRSGKEANKTRLKRAKSGSSIDYRHLEFRIRDIPIDEPTEKEGLSKSQPSLDYEEGMKRGRRGRHYQEDGVSPQSNGSPAACPSSPSLSKDSGVSDLKGKAGDVSLMERLLNADTIRHQQKLSKIVRLLREEFAFDGYMENGIEDLAMAEYVLSHGNLKWETFTSAVSEKYCDLYWQDELLANLYEAVNEFKPVINNRHVKSTERLNADPTYNQSSRQNDDQVNWGGSDSAFRPVIADGNKPLGSEGPVHKPRAQKSQTYSDSSDDSDAESSERRRRFRKKNGLEKVKSNSMHELLREKGGTRLNLVKSQSDDALLEPEVNIKKRDNHQGKPGMLKSKLIYVKSSESENDSFDSNTNATINSSIAPQQRAVMARGRGGDYLYRYDSDSSSASEQRRARNNIRQVSIQPNNVGMRPRSQDVVARQGHQAGKRYITMAKSETQLHTIARNRISDHSDTSETRDLKSDQNDHRFRTSVVYYCAEMENRVRPDVSDFSRHLDSQTKASLEAKMSELDQQMLVEMRMRKKTAKFYSKLVEATKANKATAEQKSMMNKMMKQLNEMNMKLDFLDAAKKHLEMLYAEQSGVPLEYLHSVAKCPGDNPLLLVPSENPLIQFQIVRSPEGVTESVQLQAGTPEGLMSYMFARKSLSEGYIHQFFYCYRYFTTPSDLFMFLRDKYKSASMYMGCDTMLAAKVKVRALDLLQVWLEGYYSVDFKHCPELMHTVYTFIKEKVLPLDNHAEVLLELMEDCQDGRHIDLHFPQFALTDESDRRASCTDISSPKKWESFKAALHLSAKPVKMKNMMSKKPGDRRSHAGLDGEDIYSLGKLESFNVLDYSPQELSEQLGLMEQEYFIQSHPVHYLNSKAQGIGVALANNHQVLNKDQSHYRLNSAWEESGDTSLFVGTFAVDDIIQRMIEHAHEISYWVAAEILSCASSKTQAAVLMKFIYTAKLCHEMRNYATCISILDGLDNIIVKQVPAWKNLSSKCGALMEELASVKVFLKTDSQCLLGSREERKLPTIPCILLFLLHVQQLEIAAFRLANGMYKWTKVKTIAAVVDQIRIFRECRYGFNSDHDLQLGIRQRMRDLGQQDLHALASQHDLNYTKITPNRLQGMFKRIKKNKTDV